MHWLFAIALPRVTFAVGVLLTISSVSMAADIDVVGVWLTDDGLGAVRIQPCGPNVCGYVFWLKQRLRPDGMPRADRNNPDEAKRSRPICGLQVIGSLQKQTDGTWDGGWIYDPKVGKTYDLEVMMEDPSRLTIRGYLGTKLLSRSFVWTRAPAGLASCPASASVAFPMRSTAVVA